MKDKNTFKHSCLQTGLLLGFLGWFISFIFTFSSWEFSTKILYGMGAKNIEYQPLLDYWLKMASSAFGCLGLLFFAAYRNNNQYKNLIPLLGYGSIFIGIILLISGMNNSLKADLHPTRYIDLLFCFGVGTLIIYGHKTEK